VNLIFALLGLKIQSTSFGRKAAIRQVTYFRLASSLLQRPACGQEPIGKPKQHVWRENMPETKHAKTTSIGEESWSQERRVRAHCK